jgi:protein-L-isoaspartate(D-aspartate) O-methyltransferase
MRRRLSWLLSLLAALGGGCASSGGKGAAEGETMERDRPAPQESPVAGPGQPQAERPGERERAHERAAMVKEQIEARGVRDPAVLAALRRVPRHLFMPEPERAYAYGDGPLPIGEGQTISQPYIVALMTELAAVKAGDRVLEVGTGSGYQAAVLAEIGAEVYTIEIVEPLADRSRELLADLGYDKVEVRFGDGYRGWPEKAPFAAVLITAAPPEIPQPLLDQLAVGGRLVAPVGEHDQDLVVVRRTAQGFERQTVLPVRFVPMTGEAQRQR